MTEPLDIPAIEWRRVSPKYVVVDVVGYIIFALIVLAPAALVAYFTEQIWVWIGAAALAD